MHVEHCLCYVDEKCGAGQTGILELCVWFLTSIQYNNQGQDSSANCLKLAGSEYFDNVIHQKNVIPVQRVAVP